MNLWLIVFRPDSLTYTIGRALCECGHELSVWVVDPEYAARTKDNTQTRLAALEGVHIVVNGDPSRRRPAAIDRLLVQTFPRPLETIRDLPMLAAGAQSITLISAGDRSRSWRDAMKLQWLELRTLGRLARRIDRVLYKDGFHRNDLFALFRRRQVAGFDVHSHFLHRPDQFDAMHARDWDARAQRPYLVNFLGSQDPGSRTAILDSVRDMFRTAAGETRSVRPGKTMFWHEYSDARPAGLPPTEFVAMLTRSDFTLCPRGYSLVTHRPMEALLRGSIPVLSEDELDLYGIELADGHNCIAVRNGCWSEAIERLVGLSEGEITNMRENVLAMRAVLEYRQVARGICSRLGMESQPVRGRVAAMEMAVHSRR